MSMLRATTQLLKSRDRLIAKIDDLEQRKVPHQAELDGVLKALEAIGYKDEDGEK